MNSYIVLYRDDTLTPADMPLAFACDADDYEHAEEQFENAYPKARIVWVVDTDDVEAAYADYYDSELEGDS